MSTDTNSTAYIDSLNRRIAELEADKAKLGAEAKKRRLEAKGANEALEKLKADHQALTDWKTQAEATPNAWKSKAEKLQTELRARDARDAWKEVLGDGLANKVTLEKLWGEIGYTPGEAPLTPEEITEQVTAARESAPYLFKTADETPAGDPRGSTKPPAKPPLRETVDGGRGAPVTTANRVTVRKSQLQDPVWKLEERNKEMLADAQKRGVLVITDD